MKQIRRPLAACLALLILSSCVGCGEQKTDVPAETSGAAQTAAVETAAETESLYSYPEHDYDGYTFKILNLDEFWGCYMHIDLQAQTGETVDDAVYARNRRIEERYNVNIREINETFTGPGDTDKVAKALTASILADDDSYDCAYAPISSRPALVTDGYLVDLYEIPELRLDEPWWDVTLNKTLELNGKLYIATSPLQLTSLDLSWVLLFNKKLLQNQDIEFPYQQVKDGTWTFDAWNTYVSKLANLNGDSSFTYTPDGKAVYGIAGHNTTPYLGILATGNCFIQRDENGLPYYVGATEHLFSSIDKVKTTFNVNDGKIHYDPMDGLGDPGGYYNLFYYDRAGFLTTELKGTKVMRNMDSDYGILPMPKYDENQKDYVTYASENIGRLCIPKTNDDLSRTGTLLDTLSFESWQYVLPLYYNQTLSQKGLRDEESIEMLDIINASRMTEIGLIYGTTSMLISSLSDMIVKNQDNASSIMSKNEKSCQDKLNKLLDAIG